MPFIHHNVITYEDGDPFILNTDIAKGVSTHKWHSIHTGVSSYDVPAVLFPIGVSYHNVPCNK